MTAKGQMNSTSRVSIITASQAGKNSQTNGFEHTIVSSILTDLIFQRTSKEAKEEEQYRRSPPLNQRSSRVRAMRFKILNWHKHHHQLQHKSWSGIKKRMSLTYCICWSKSLLKSQWIICIEFEDWKHRINESWAKRLTNGPNKDPNNTIQLRNFHENQITKEIGLSVARANPLIWPLPELPVVWRLGLVA
jgi:hypothetical protein